MACTCRENNVALPELDARTIPHLIRHGAIMGAISSLGPGFAFALVAPHDPVPLLDQIRDKFGSSVEVTYLESGPTWRLRISRLGA